MTQTRQSEIDNSANKFMKRATQRPKVILGHNVLKGIINKLVSRLYEMYYNVDVVYNKKTNVFKITCTDDAWNSHLVIDSAIKYCNDVINGDDVFNYNMDVSSTFLSVAAFCKQFIIRNEWCNTINELRIHKRETEYKSTVTSIEKNSKNSEYSVTLYIELDKDLLEIEEINIDDLGKISISIGEW